MSEELYFEPPLPYKVATNLEAGDYIESKPHLLLVPANQDQPQPTLGTNTIYGFTNQTRIEDRVVDLYPPEGCKLEPDTPLGVSEVEQTYTYESLPGAILLRTLVQNTAKAIRSGACNLCPINNCSLRSGKVFTVLDELSK